MKKVNGDEMRKGLIIAAVIAAVLIISMFYSNFSQVEITNFEECIAAGNPAMESHPRQCIDSRYDKTFVEVIDDAWRLDGIQLMQHETDGFYACFGCNVPKGNGPAMCIDPAPVMKPVEETAERYCDVDFEVIELSQ